MRCSGPYTCLINLPRETSELSNILNIRARYPISSVTGAHRQLLQEQRDSSKIAVGCNPNFILLSVVEIYIDDPVWPNSKYQMYFYRLATAIFDIAS